MSNHNQGWSKRRIPPAPAVQGSQQPWPFLSFGEDSERRWHGSGGGKRGLTRRSLQVGFKLKREPCREGFRGSHLGWGLAYAVCLLSSTIVFLRKAPMRRLIAVSLLSLSCTSAANAAPPQLLNKTIISSYTVATPAIEDDGKQIVASRTAQRRIYISSAGRIF